MVIRVQETLTKEDRAAWRRLAARENRVRKRWERGIWVGYGVIWAGWLTLKLFGAFTILIGARFLPHAVCADTPLWLKIFGVLDALALIGSGICLLGLLRRSPGRPPGHDFGRLLPTELPTDAPIRAVFFGDGYFTFWDARGKVRLGYSSIDEAWEDEGRFYLLFRDRPPLALPKRGFAGCGPEAFRDFLEDAAGFPAGFLK